MKMLKKIVAILLVITTILSMFAGCSSTEDNTEYLSNGEFYALFIENTNMYNDDYSEENPEDYEAAEYLLYDRFILDDKQLNNYKDTATKEIVAQVCVRYMEFRQTCSVEIKDIEKCYDQQSVIDAVGMEIFTLENGYFSAKEKMTESDCQKAIDKMINIELNSHYEEGELEVEFQDDVIVLDEDIEINDFKVWEETIETTPTSSNDEIEINNLEYKSEDNNTEVVTLANHTSEKMMISIPKVRYQTMAKKPVVNKVMLTPNFSNNSRPSSMNGFSLYEPIAIMVTSIDENPVNDPLSVHIYGREPSADEFLKDSENEEKINKKNCSTGASVNKVSDSSVPEGIRIDTNSKPGTLVVTFGHTFTITDKVYGKQTWRNPSASPSVNITVEIGDFKLDTKNIGKLILNKKSDAEVKLTYNTAFKTTLKAGGLRYSPANNGNGGLKYSPENGFSGNFFANLGNARFTGASAGGSKSIKLAQVNIPLGYGFSINTNLYLVIQLDGTITFEVSGNHSAELKVSNTRKGIDVDFNTKSVKKEKYEVNANLTVEFQLTPNISFLGLQIIDAVGKVGGTIDAMASIYSTESKQSSAKIYATQCELEEQCSSGNFKYCIGSSFTLYLGYEFLTTDSVIGKFIINGLGFKTPSDKFTIYSGCCHFEDGDYVDACTRDTEDIEKNSEGEIKLTEYKIIANYGEQTSTSVESIPISNKKLEKNGGITVKTADKKIATATFNEATNTILITAVDEGSTEITVRIRKKKKGKDYYEQQISVTVNENLDVEQTTFDFADRQVFYKTMNYC